MDRDYMYFDKRYDELTKELSDPEYAFEKEQERQEERKRREWKKGFSRYNQFQRDYARAIDLLKSNGKMIEDARNYYSNGYSVKKEIVKTCASLAALISLLLGTYKLTGKGDLNLKTAYNIDQHESLVAEECFIREDDVNNLTFKEYANLDLEALKIEKQIDNGGSFADLYDKALLVMEKIDVDKELNQETPVSNRIIGTGLLCFLYFMLYVLYIALKSLTSDKEVLTLVERIEKIIFTLNNTKDTKMSRKEYDILIDRMNKELKKVFKETKNMMESKPVILSKIENIKSNGGLFYLETPLVNAKYFIDEAYDCLYNLENSQAKRARV